MCPPPLSLHTPFATECAHVVHHGGHCGSSCLPHSAGGVRLELQALLMQPQQQQQQQQLQLHQQLYRSSGVSCNRGRVAAHDPQHRQQLRQLHHYALESIASTVTSCHETLQQTDALICLTPDCAFIDLVACCTKVCVCITACVHAV